MKKLAFVVALVLMTMTGTALAATWPWGTRMLVAVAKAPDGLEYCISHKGVSAGGVLPYRKCNTSDAAQKWQVGRAWNSDSHLLLKQAGGAGLCIGVLTPGSSLSYLTLQSCDVTSSMWVKDQAGFGAIWLSNFGSKHKLSSFRDADGKLKPGAPMGIKVPTASDQPFIMIR